jgi:hypothetical protein
MRLAHLRLGFLLVSLTGCTRSSEPQDSFEQSQYSQSFADKLRFESSAPNIVLGRVLELEKAGKPRTSPGDSRVKTQLTRIKINVEKEIQGNIGVNPLQFVYFTFSSENTADLGVPRYIPEVGQRRIYFLKPSGDSFRSVGDVTDYTLKVRSGTHVGNSCLGKPGCCIADLLLIPGELDLDANAFIRDLDEAEYAGEILCSRSVALDLLTRLTKNPDQRIAERASEIMMDVLSR